MKKIDVVAPGVDVMTTTPVNNNDVTTHINSHYAYMTGSSAAVPFVSGLSALLKQKNTKLNVYQLRHIIKASANDILDSDEMILPGMG